MPKTKISEYDLTPANNTDIDSIDIGEGCAPSGINNAIRELMSQLKDFQGGTSGDKLAIAAGGTNATTTTAALQNLGGTTTGINIFKATDNAAVRSAISAASSGANSDITSLSGLTTALSVDQGGTGITSFGTGVATALGQNVTGSSGIVLSTEPTITALKEIQVAVSGSNIAVNTGNYFTRTISGTTTFTVSGVPSSGTGIAFILDLTNGGSATVNWFSGVKWAGGTAPTLTASGRDVLGFYTHDGGTNWNGFLLGKDVK